MKQSVSKNYIVILAISIMVPGNVPLLHSLVDAMPPYNHKSSCKQQNWYSQNGATQHTC